MWSAPVRGVVKMKAEPVRAAFAEDANVPRSNDTPAGREKRRAAALHQILPFAIKIRSRHRFAAAHAHLLGAVRAAAALTPVDEQKIIFTVARQARRFDGIVPRKPARRNGCVAAPSSLGIKFDEINPAPI